MLTGSLTARATTGSMLAVIMIGVSEVVLTATEEAKSIEASEIGVTGDCSSIVVDELSFEHVSMVLAHLLSMLDLGEVVGMSIWIEGAVPVSRPCDASDALMGLLEAVKGPASLTAVGINGPGTL